MTIESKNLTPQSLNGSVYDMLFNRSSDIDPNKPCFVDAEDQSQMLTFCDVKQLILKFAAALKRTLSDFSKGDVVAFYSANNATYAAAVHGPSVIGGSSALVDCTNDVPDLVESLKLVKAKVIIADEKKVHNALDAARLLSIPKENVFVFGNRDIHGARSFNKTFLCHNEITNPVHFDPEDSDAKPCYFYFTSGTTGGKKKAVVVSYRMIYNAVVVKKFPFHQNFRMLCGKHFHHASTLYFTMCAFPFHGLTTYFMKEFTFENYLKAVQDCSLNFIFVSPSIGASLVKEPIVDNYDISSLQCIAFGGSSISPLISEAIFKKFKIPILNIYGTSEIIRCFASDPKAALAGEVGSLEIGCECKLIDDNGQEVGSDIVGELYIKGPTMTPGYYNDPVANTEAFVDGWFKTGDLFKLTEKGNAIFVDRVKNIIQYKTFRIVPQDIENVLLLHPLIVDCAVVGIYCKTECTWLPRAYVVLARVLNPNLSKIEEETQNLIETKLSNEMQLRGGFYFVKRLPKTATGKIKRYRLCTNDAHIVYSS